MTDDATNAFSKRPRRLLEARLLGRLLALGAFLLVLLVTIRPMLPGVDSIARRPVVVSATAR